MLTSVAQTFKRLSKDVPGTYRSLLEICIIWRLFSIVIVGCVTIAATMGFKVTFKIFKCKKEPYLKNKKDSKNISISELSNPNWVKIGYVKALNIYPIRSGKGLSHHSFKFTQHGMSMEDKGLTIMDGMFLVLDVMSGKFLNFKDYKSLSSISVNVIDSCTVSFDARGMPTLILKMDQKTKKIFPGAMWHDNLSVMECIDCGETASIWINSFLRSTNLRLVQTNHKSTTQQTNIIKEYWSRYASAYTNVNEYHSGNFTNLARYVLMTKTTFDQLNEEKMFTDAFSVRPNIVVSAPSFFAYAEKNWQWIKIGNAILRQVKPVPRYLPAYVRNSLKHQFFEQILPHFGVYYGLYVAGDVKINDEIYIHVPKDERELEINADKQK